MTCRGLNRSTIISGVARKGPGQPPRAPVTRGAVRGAWGRPFSLTKISQHCNLKRNSGGGGVNLGVLPRAPTDNNDIRVNECERESERKRERERESERKRERERVREREWLF